MSDERPCKHWSAATAPECVTCTADLHARLATAEKALAEWTAVARERAQKLAIAGVEGSPPPGQDTTIGTWMALARKAERALAEEREKSARLEKLCAEYEDGDGPADSVLLIDSVRREAFEEGIRAIDAAFEADQDIAPQDVLRALASHPKEPTAPVVKVEG